MRANSRDWDLFYAGGLVIVALVLTGCEAADTARSSAALPEATHDAIAPRVAAPSVEPVPQYDTHEAGMSPAPAEPVDPATARVAWGEGVQLFDRRDYGAAAEKLTVAAAGRTEDAYTHYLLGLALWKSGQNGDAVTVLERSASLAPGSIRTWTNLARVRLDQDDAAEALAAAEQALGLDASSSEATHQKGRALAKLGRAAEALDVLAHAHEAAPENGFVANTLGLLLLQSGRSAEAVPLFEAARDRLPGVAYVRNNLAVAYERTGQGDLAVAEYRAAVEAGDSGGKAAASLARLDVPLAPETPPVETAMSVETPGSGSTN